MPRKRNLPLTTAVIGAAIITAIYYARPRRPAFKVISLTSLNLNLNHNPLHKSPPPFHHFPLPLPQLSADLIVTVNVTNPNIIPVRYAPSSLSIFYDGSLLGVADVPGGSQSSRSCKTLQLPAKLDGFKLLVRHAKKLFSDVAKRRMNLDAEMDLCARVKGISWWWGPKFNVRLDTRIVVDPMGLEIVDQQNVSTLRISM